jgi:hypothetical protein
LPQPLAPIADSISTKQKYLNQLNEVAEKLNNEEISVRTAYHEISMIVRLFVYEVTNIKAHHCTLDDIKQLNMPTLYELIQEYYAPEFSEQSLGDFPSSLDRTRKVIEQWN